MTTKVFDFYPEKHERTTALPTSWETHPLPSLRTTIPLDRKFSADEMKLIQMGLVPAEMEDKWFIYWKEDSLYFHRSWTGLCTYIVHFVPEEAGYRMVTAEVNRDPEQYKVKDDQLDTKMISYLIDLLLLEHDAEFPSEETSPEVKALKNWSQVGRAMFDHPSVEE